MTVPPGSRRTLHAALLLVVVLAVLSPVAPARAASTYLCYGYTACAQDGHPHFGYKNASGRMWWRMYSGHNCTNYVAYRLVRRGMSAERPWSGTGMAYNWGRANRRITDDTPRVGAVAWWNAGDGVGASGHVAYVQKVVSRRKIVISEDSWGGDFHWRVITKPSGWPTGFVHFLDEELAVVTAPSVTGTPAVGETLTAGAGTFRPAGSTRLQWLANGKPVAGATGATFTLTPAQRRARMSVQVSATARGYAPTTATSAPTEPVVAGELAVATQPTLSGTPRVDEVMTLAPGASSPQADSSVVRWFADGSRIDGVTGTRLRLGQELIQRQITAVVVSRRAGYRRLRTTTTPSARVQAGLIEVGTEFTLTGRALLGRRLAVRPGTFRPADAAVSYHWLRDGQPIAGATGTDYTPVLADVGHRVTAQVQLRRTGYRNLAVDLEPGTFVTTRPALAVRTVGRVRRAVVRVRVAAPGVADPGGEATVRLGRRVETRPVVDGVVRVVFRRLPPGTRRVRVRYAGTDVVLPRRARASVVVRGRR